MPWSGLVSPYPPHRLLRVTRKAAAGVSLTAPVIEPRSVGKTNYGGTFYSDELEATFTVTLKGDTVMLQRDSDLEASALEPAADGAFRWSGMTVRFEHGGDGAVGTLVVDAGRVRDIRFTRKAPRRVGKGVRFLFPAGSSSFGGTSKEDTRARNKI